MASLAPSTGVLLEGDVLHIGFYRVGKTPYPEDVLVPAVLRALAQYMKVDLQTEGIFWGDYCYFAGVTGEAFRFLEFMGLDNSPPDHPLVERYGHLAVAEMYHEAFAAAGLRAEIHLKPQLPARSLLLHQLVESLAERRCPVIGFGFFGPHEPFLITGYDPQGEVLLGWSHLQGDKKDAPDISFAPTGQFRLRNWYEVIGGVAIITETTERPPAQEIFRRALVRGVRELQTVSGAYGGVQGTAAVEAWATLLENEPGFLGWTDPQWQRAHQDHGITAGDLAERRALGDSFLQLASRFLPEAAEDLRKAATAFTGAHDTVYEIWETAAKTGPFDPDLEKFKDPACRRQMAGLVRRLAQLDHRARAFMTNALRIVDRQEPGPKYPVDQVLDGVAILTKAPPRPAPAASRWGAENIALPNALGMLGAFLGESFGDLSENERAYARIDYHLWMGLSGAAFGLPGTGPEGANLELVLEALGYDYELWMGKDLAEQTGLSCRIWGWDDNLRRRIFWNLRDRRLPVLLFNCGPWPDWWLVTHAERWGAFQGYGGCSGEGNRPGEPLDHPRNPLRVIDLFGGMKGRQTWTINLLARRSAPRPRLVDLYRRAADWGTQQMGRPQMRLLDGQGVEFVSTRPYQDWAAMIRTDTLFPAQDPQTLMKRRQWLERCAAELWERRFYGAGFLSLAAARLSRQGLREAAQRFLQARDLAGEISRQLGSPRAPEPYLSLGNAQVRDTIAQCILELEREDLAAAALLRS